MNVREAFRAQAEDCLALGSPFTARLCRTFAERLAPGDPVADRILGWPADPGPHEDRLPLRLAGALHGLVLSGRAPDLAAVYPPHPASDDALFDAATGAMRRHAPAVLARLEGPPQTNEPRRSAPLAAGMLTVAAATSLPLVLSEIGASAGLNVCWDRHRYRFGAASWGDPSARLLIAPDWEGPPPPVVPIEIADRAAVDRDPFDLARDEDRLRLLSFVWPDQTERLARVATAIEVARESDVRVERCDAVEWLIRRLAVPHPGAVHVLYHSIVWHYLTAATKARGQAAIEAAGNAATSSSPLAWLRMEGDDATPGAAVTLTLWPSGETRQIGRADFHGAWVRWRGWEP